MCLSPYASENGKMLKGALRDCPDNPDRMDPQHNLNRSGNVTPKLHFHHNSEEPYQLDG